MHDFASGKEAADRLSGLPGWQWLGILNSSSYVFAMGIVFAMEFPPFSLLFFCVHVSILFFAPIIMIPIAFFFPVILGSYYYFFRPLLRPSNYDHVNLLLPGFQNRDLQAGIYHQVNIMTCLI